MFADLADEAAQDYAVRGQDVSELKELSADLRKRTKG